MKKRSTFILASLIIPFLVGCTMNLPARSSSSGTSNSSSESGSSSTSSKSEHSGTSTINFFAINDFHGAVNESPSESRMGILTLGSYLKEQGAKPNTVLLNSGDMFQGSIESNYNRGRLLTDCMNEIEFDAFTLGNHEFDWGADIIAQNKLRIAASDGYQTPWLAANIYNYDSVMMQDGDQQQSQLGDEYTVVELENGCRVGIIGVIGSEQWTSIASTHVDDYVFKDPVPIIKNLSDELRTEHGCDLVVVDIHASQYALLGTGITNVSPVSGKKYADLVFCAHTHRLETEEENGVFFAQNSAYGQNFSKVVLTVTDGEVTNYRYTNYQYGYVSPENGIDPNLQALVDSYGEESSAAANERLGTAIGTFWRDESLPNMLAESILQEAESEGFDVDLAMVNSTRNGLNSGAITYGRLFECVPFDNAVYIVECQGADIINEADYNCFARKRTGAFNYSDTYRIAVLDYLALHKNYGRMYDYFPTVQVVDRLEKNDEMYCYRDILAQYIRNHQSVDPDDYSSSLPRYNRGSLLSSITL